MLLAGLRAIQAILLATAAYLGFWTVAPVVSSTPLPEISLAEAPSAAVNRPQLAHFAVISERNLFRTRESGPLAAPTAEQLAESSLKFVLRGTAVNASRPELSTAVVEDPAKRETLVVAPGDRLGAALVQGIQSDRLVVEYNGRLEQISFEEEEGSSPGSARARSSASRRTAATRAAARRAARRPATKATQRVTPRSTPSSVARRTAPAGPAVGNLGALLSHPDLQLQPGERLKTVNGIDLADGSRIEELMDSISGDGPKSFVITTRDGGERRVEVP